MSETNDKTARRAARAARDMAGGSGNRNQNFTVAAHGDGVVLVETASGRSWTLVEAEGRPTWHPVDYAGVAEKAPRRRARDAGA